MTLTCAILLLMRFILFSNILSYVAEQLITTGQKIMKNKRPNQTGDLIQGKEDLTRRRKGEEAVSDHSVDSGDDSGWLRVLKESFTQIFKITYRKRHK